MFQEQTGRRNQNLVLKLLGFWLVTAKPTNEEKQTRKRVPSPSKLKAIPIGNIMGEERVP